MDWDWLIVGGLGFDVLGAGILAWQSFLSPKEAMQRGLGVIAADTQEENLKLAPVQRLLREARYAKIAFVFLLLGFALQAAGQLPA